MRWFVRIAAVLAIGVASTFGAAAETPSDDGFRVAQASCPQGMRPGVGPDGRPACLVVVPSGRFPTPAEQECRKRCNAMTGDCFARRANKLEKGTDQGAPSCNLLGDACRASGSCGV